MIVDIQGFKTTDKIFTPKELATYDGNIISHYIFRPPFPFAALPTHLQKQATWLMTNHHCIDWTEGFTPAYEFPRIFRRILQGASGSPVREIYVKGCEKAAFLRRFTDKPIIEIEDQPALSPTQPSCMYHLQPVCYCALSNVYHLYNHYIMK